MTSLTSQTKTSVSKNLTLAFYGKPSTALASYDNKTIVIDGKIEETSWLLYTLIQGRPGTPGGAFGRLWNGSDLYLAIDTDGAKEGFDLEMLAAVCDAVSVPVIASGGAGKTEDFITLFKTLPKVDAGLAASVFHFGEIKIEDLKKEMALNGIPVRL